MEFKKTLVIAATDKDISMDLEDELITISANDKFTPKEVREVILKLEQLIN